jgi:hypothetical protein
LAAFTRLSATDRKNSAWQHDVAEAQTNIGDALLAEGKLSEAIEHYRSGFAVMEMLTAVDPGNKQWENERVNLHRKLAKNQHEPEQH